MMIVAQLIAVLLGLAQPEPPPKVSPELAARLTALDPRQPSGYFLLAEELADEPTSEQSAALAVRLYVLAFALQPEPAAGASRDASTLLGLAAVEPRQSTRRWLEALASSVDRRLASFDWNVAAAPALSEQTAWRAATALGLARAGEGRDARKLLAEPGIIDVFRKYERVIGTTGREGALSRLQTSASLWPCPECANARFVTRQGARGPEIRLCPTCGGNPGPKLTPDEYVSQLRFESLLLNGIHRSWAAQLLVESASPLRDPDPADLPEVYGIDITAPCWRDGRWVACEGAPKKSVPAATPSPVPAPKPAVPAPSQPAPAKTPTTPSNTAGSQ